MTNVEMLAQYLQERGLVIGGMTLGTKATPEDVAGEILRSLRELESEEYYERPTI